MKKVVIIGANDFQNPLILKAKEMGYETHVFAWKDGSIGERTADYFYPISIVEKELILEKCREIKPDAVASIASDLAIITVNYLAKQLGLIGNNEECCRISTNKFDMRKALMERNISTPKFCQIGKGESLYKVMEVGFQFPIIIKPTDRSGSRGITKLNSFDGIENAIKNAIDNSFEKKAIIEEYIDGEEYSCECISYQGNHHYLAVTKKYTTGAPHFIETAQLEPAILKEEQINTIKEQVFFALDALQIKNGASHAEFKIDKNGKVKIIEIGGRMGGDCIGSDLVWLSTGYDFVKMVLQVALGEEPQIESVGEKYAAVIRFIFNKQDFEHYKILEKNYPEKIVKVSDIKIDENSQITDSSSRYGFYILQCENVEEAIRLANL